MLEKLPTPQGVFLLNRKYEEVCTIIIVFQYIVSTKKLTNHKFF